MGELKAKEYKRFEDIKHTRKDGSEYWLARELAEVLDYTQWRNFAKVIDKAMVACNNSGHDVVYDFAEVSKIVEAGATAKPVKDYELSRYYGGLTVEDIHTRKGLAVRDKILDFMGSTELIANLFRISQTEEKLKRDEIDNAYDATATHLAVGREVRAAIDRVGGTMPEDLPTPEKSIAQIEKEQIAKLKQQAKEKPLMLDEQ